MVEIELDGKKVEIAEGSMVMHAADKAGTYIPHFCYHKKLSIAANCRMCLVDVEKAPKPMPACATPVTNGMIVRTRSEKAVKAQQSVMEFLLINHPLDCPICDQGGECQLQDLAVGYGGSASRYEEEKRVVLHKDVGPLISMEEMSRCIHCTRCVRFGQEVAGVMELGMIHRGEHSEITTVLGDTVDSEVSGNMIDLCPVGALTSKPFRYSARNWELSRRKSVSPHDSTGANLIVQVKNHKVMRVLPLENEAVNECWLADRDRFSYEALDSEERLTSPMIKQGGEWKTVDWQTALEYVANGLKQVKAEHGARSIGALVSPHSTVEELFLAGALVRGLGSENIDYRLRHAEFASGEGVRWLGMRIAELSTLQRALVLGSNVRKEHPLFSLRLRAATRKGAQISVIHDADDDWAMPLQARSVVPAGQWAQALGALALEIAKQKGVEAPASVVEGLRQAQPERGAAQPERGAAQPERGAAQPERGAAQPERESSVHPEPVEGPHPTISAIAKSLLSGDRKAILLGNAAAHHAKAGALLALANWIGEQTGAMVGYLTEAANTVGAQLVGAQPRGEGLNAGQMATPGALKAVLLFNNEPAFDCAGGARAAAAIGQAEMVVTLSPFKANMDISDVLLPIAPFSETPGSFVNAEGRLQGFHAVARPLGETRPGWKVLRVLGNLLGLPGFDQESSQEVLAAALGAQASQELFVPADRLDNRTRAAIDLAVVPGRPATASIYQLDSIVRRATSLQLTADARLARAREEQQQAQGEPA